MANLNPEAAPRTGLADLWRELKHLRQEVGHLRSSQNVVGRAAVIGRLVGGGWVNLSATGFALAPAGANVISSTITVPAGFSACTVALIGRVYAVNPTAASDYIYARAEVEMTTGTAVPVHAAPAGTPGDGAVNVSPLSTTLTNLTPGSQFTVRLWAASALAAWVADVDNTADLTGTLTWIS